MTYDHEGHGAWKIEGLEPEGSSTGLPVFVFLKGTGDSFGALSNSEFVEAMAHRGFLSAEVDYPSPMIEYEWFIIMEQWGDNGMGKYVRKVKRSKAEKIFPPALDALCNHSRADCSAGVAVSGYGQGGYITLFSVQFDSRITAVMPLAVECLEDRRDFTDVVLSRHVPPSNRLIIVGEDQANLE
eukprot:1314870-Rhodomonas_salina.1